MTLFRSILVFAIAYLLTACGTRLPVVVVEPEHHHRLSRKPRRRWRSLRTSPNGSRHLPSAPLPVLPITTSSNCLPVLITKKKWSVPTANSRS